MGCGGGGAGRGLLTKARRGAASASRGGEFGGEAGRLTKSLRSAAEARPQPPREAGQPAVDADGLGQAVDCEALDGDRAAGGGGGAGGPLVPLVPATALAPMATALAPMATAAAAMRPPVAMPAALAGVVPPPPPAVLGLVGARRRRVGSGEEI